MAVAVSGLETEASRKERFRSSGSGIFQIGFAEALSPNCFAVEDDGYGNAGSAGCFQEFVGGGLDFFPFLGGERSRGSGLLSRNGCGGGKKCKHYREQVLGNFPGGERHEEKLLIFWIADCG